jgi:hypothetical protein
MVIYVLGAIALYIIIQVWGFLAPYLLQRAFFRNKKLIGHIKDLHKAYDAMENNSDDFCRRYPDDCLSALEKRYSYRLCTEEEYLAELQKIESYKLRSSHHRIPQ